MRHAPGQPADSFHLLCLAQLLFQSLAFTNVLCHHHTDFPSAIFQRVRNNIYFENLAVLLAMLPDAVILPGGFPVLLMLAQCSVFFGGAYVEESQCCPLFLVVAVLADGRIIHLYKYECFAIEDPGWQRIV